MRYKRVGQVCHYIPQKSGCVGYNTTGPNNNRPICLLVGKALSFTYELSFFLFFLFINPLRSAAAQWTAIKCIPEVRS